MLWGKVPQMAFSCFLKIVIFPLKYKSVCWVNRLVSKDPLTQIFFCKHLCNYRHMKKIRWADRAFHQGFVGTVLASSLPGRFGISRSPHPGATGCLEELCLDSHLCPTFRFLFFWMPMTQQVLDPFLTDGCLCVFKFLTLFSQSALMTGVAFFRSIIALSKMCKVNIPLNIHCQRLLAFREWDHPNHVLSACPLHTSHLPTHSFPSWLRSRHAYFLSSVSFTLFPWVTPGALPGVFFLTCL